MRWKVLGLVVFALIVAVFTLINTTQVTVDFLFVKTQMNLVLVILVSVLLGMILMAILWSLRAWKLRSETRALSEQIARLEKALNDATADRSEDIDTGDETPSAPQNAQPHVGDRDDTGVFETPPKAVGPMRRGDTP